MKCQSCNGNLKSNSKFCPKCGAPVSELKKEPVQEEVKVENPVNNNQVSNDDGSIGWGILGFFIPIVGVILFIIWLHDKPKSGKSAGIGALIGIIMRIIMAIILIVFYLKIFNYSINIPNYYDYDDYNYYDDYDYDYDYDYDLDEDF